MVAKFKFESKYGQGEVKIKVKEKSLFELLAKPIQNIVTGKQIGRAHV